MLSQGGFEFKVFGSVLLLLTSANEMLRLIKCPDRRGRFKGTESERLRCFLESREKGTPRVGSPEEKVELPPGERRKELESQYRPCNSLWDTS